MSDDQRDVIEILGHDHREVEEMFSELEALRGAPTDEALARRKELADQVTIELSSPIASLFDRMRDLATGRGSD